MRTVLITGANGFLGSHITREFLARGFLVYGLVRQTSDSYRLGDCIQNPFLKLIHGSDMEDIDCLDVVIHTATSYGRVGETNQEILSVNFELPKKILGLAQKKSCPLFINADTFMPADISLEDRYYQYAKTKKMFLEYGKNSRGTGSFVNLVLYHMYGPMDNPTKFLPWIIGQMKREVEVIELSAGEQVRDFVYIDDVVSAFVAAAVGAQSFGAFEEFQIGMGQGYSIKELVMNLKDLLGSKSELAFGARPYQHGEIMHSCADTSGNGKIGWRARVSLIEGLARTVDYYKTHDR